LSSEFEERNLEVADVSWHVLKPHLQRDALITVSAQFDLIEVAKTIAADKSETIQKWIGEGALAKPNAEQVEAWNSDPTVEFLCAIVQPFVLMQLKN
jgi:hypothetical protein